MSLDKNNIFFILGRARSGTTLLRELINNHPDVHIPTESTFILHLYKKYYPKVNNIDEFISDLFLEPFIYAWKISKEELKMRLIALESNSFKVLCFEVLKYNLTKKENNYIIGDKNPIYSIFPETLHQIYPEAKFVKIIRDYRANINSLLKVDFEKKIISSLAIRWKSFIEHSLKFQTKYPDKILIIKYEDLVSDTENVLKKICDFLNIEYNNEMLNNNAKKFNIYDQSLKEPVNNSHIMEWEKQLTKNQIIEIENIVGKFGEKFGYIKKYPSYKINLIFIFYKIIYGYLYIPFLKFTYFIPLSWRVYFNMKILYPNSKFWQRLKQEYQI